MNSTARIAGIPITKCRQHCAIWSDAELSFHLTHKLLGFLNPSRFDVILCDNLFGDILSDEGSVLSGSMGLLPSASKGEKSALYEPIHGSYPQATGKDIANPLATILSVEMMLRDFGYIDEANEILYATDQCISEGFLTEDLRPVKPVRCSELGDKVAGLIV